MTPLYPNRAAIPPDVRAAVLKRAERCCEACGKKAPLEMHHTTYQLHELTGYHRDFGEPIFGHETPDVLRALCRDCHHEAHMTPWGEFIGDIDERDEQVSHWDHVMEDD
jgi:5-methylcytosine-specific restriction endonuclease McrA